MMCTLNLRLTLAKVFNWLCSFEMVSLFQTDRGKHYPLTGKKEEIMVYILDQDGHPLMPTNRHGRVRHLLKEGKAKVVRKCPFTIQLLYKTGGHTQPVTLGVDAGSKHIGLSASTEKQELFSAQAECRTDIVKNLSKRRILRRSRRNRKTRHRPARFNNRVHSKHKGWLAPSVEHKLNTHITLIQKACAILPITKIRIETAQFDTQRLKADIQNTARPQGTDYQNGEQKGFYNVREYVLFRDQHQCQCCHGKSKDKVLHVHHIESRQTGGDGPGNLITLCRTCHQKLHAGKIKLSKKRSKSMRDAAFMGIMRKTLFVRLKALMPEMPIEETFGYETKLVRDEHGILKTHTNDARCIAQCPEAAPASETYRIKKVRRHNRKLFKEKICKGGIKKRNQAAFEVKGFRRYDKVRFNGETCFITGRRTKGYMSLSHADGTKVSASALWKKLKLLAHANGFIIERRTAIPPTAKAVGILAKY